VEAGQRITAEVVTVDRRQGKVRLSLAATENPELWAFLTAHSAGPLAQRATTAAVCR
jgi:small subunit ribosomal protein S1